MSCTLETTAEKFVALIEQVKLFSILMNGHTYEEEANSRIHNKHGHLRFRLEQTYRQLYTFVNLQTNPTFDEIDAMLMVCKALLTYERTDWVAEFIMNCPPKFMLAYANNSETVLAVLDKLVRLGLDHVRMYIIGYIHESKLHILIGRGYDFAPRPTINNVIPTIPNVIPTIPKHYLCRWNDIVINVVADIMLLLT